MRCVLLVVFSLFVFLLSGCKSATKTQTEIALNEISVIERQITNIQDKLPEECKTLLYDDFINIKTNLDSVKKSVSQINIICNQEKSLLKSEIRIKSICIIVLFSFIIILIYKKIKK